ncbi:hypothetical protein D9M71_455910 [compost metagenome]
MHGVAEGVGQHLGFDVLRIDDALLEEDFRTAERLGGFGDHAGVGLFQFLAAVAAADAAAAATGSGLEHHRVADALGFAQRLVEVGDVAFGTGGAGHAGGDHAAPGFGLVAHAADHLGRRADELDPALGADFRQLGVLGEEAIARVQRVAAGFHGEVHQRARIQVAGQRIGADAVRFVGTLDVQRVAVGLGIDGYRADAHLGAGAHDADSDFPTVGDQDFLDHFGFPSTRARWTPVHEPIGNPVRKRIPAGWAQRRIRLPAVFYPNARGRINQNQ